MYKLDLKCKTNFSLYRTFIQYNTQTTIQKMIRIHSSVWHVNQACHGDVLYTVIILKNPSTKKPQWSTLCPSIMNELASEISDADLYR
jgi:hypothetical protein